VPPSAIDNILSLPALRLFTFNGSSCIFTAENIISRKRIGDHGKNQVLYSEGIKKAVPEH
jgi:hypothetical protein